MSACRSCGAILETTLVDLGDTPLANSYLTAQQLPLPEATYPLHARVCSVCLLVQVDDAVSPEEIFSDYAYFSSVSDSWVEHAARYARHTTRRLDLGPHSSVVEVASNDGYLLQHFVEAGVPVLGIEPAANVGDAARAVGVPTETAFFGTDTATALGLQADLLIGNNVLAHVPDLNDFAEGIRMSLKPSGVVSLEVPHLLRLVEGIQFDTIYHEHYSYFSLLAAQHVFAAHGLTVFDVDVLPTHGGSIRIWSTHDSGTRKSSDAVEAVLRTEQAAGLDRLDTYECFSAKVRQRQEAIVDFLTESTRGGQTVVGYGAAAKGNTLLNFCRVTTDLMPFVVDRSPHKQGLHLPGTHLPILSPDVLCEAQPDHILLLAWNLADEIITQLEPVRGWGATLVTTMPTVRQVG